MEGSALFSTCGRHRFLLRRGLAEGMFAPPPKVLVFAMLNPSTATADEDDPTIRRCIGYARREGATAMEVVNLFSLRSTDPEALLQVDEPTLDENEVHIRCALEGAWEAVFAWGAHPAVRRHAAELVQRMVAWRPDAKVLGWSRHGHPRHPLYVRRDAPFTPFLEGPPGGA